jgi:hypothetical protein
MLWQLADFRDRDLFGHWLNAQGLTGGYGVEVGTHRGEFARQLALKWDCRKLYCVDNYASGYSDRDPISSGDRSADLKAATEVFSSPFISGKVQLLKVSSAEAATRFHADSLDFAYIDACHEREEFEGDLGRWYHAIKPGGILAGHDVICPGEPLETNWGAEIQPTLWEFACHHRLVIYLIAETQSLPWSWYVRKPS